MSTDWFHDLETAGKGPDWYFNAAFAPGSAAALAEAFRALAPQGFTRYDAQAAHCPIHSRLCDYGIYLVTSQAAALINNIEGKSTENIYVYHTIQACQEDLQLVRGYGGYSGQHGAEETRLVRALAQAPGLALQRWSVSYGGMGYPFEVLAQGHSAAELLRYLGQPGQA